MSDTAQGASVPLDKLARTYRRMQAKIQELTKAYETEIETIKAQQDAIKNALKDQLMSLGVKSVNTAEGTVILGTKTRYFTQDWDSFKDFIKEHDAPHLLQQRIHDGNLKQFLEENPDTLPVGLNADTKYAITVRKPTNK